MDLCNSIARIVCIVRTGPILECSLGSAVQRIVGIGCRLALSIKERGEIAIIVVGVGFGVEQGILSRTRPIHVAIGIHRLLSLGIGQGQELSIDEWRVVNLGATSLLWEKRGPFRGNDREHST